MKLARGLIVALLVLMVAVTPISAMFRQGHFEASMRASSEVWLGPPTVTLDDHTGLVMTFVSVEVAPPTSVDDRILVVQWLGGCSEQLVSLTFLAIDDVYRIDKREVSNGCPLLSGHPRIVVSVLRAPIDATTVEFDALEASVQ